tara:strand:- start:2995 stop:3378 length:384 start_codon:yes stop_codon:yes gene_type:complete
MKKILLGFLITLFLSVSVNAENHLQPPLDSDGETFNFYWTQMPAVCGPRADVAGWITKHEFTPVSVSFGRENGQAEGQVVYVVTVYINPGYQMMAIAETQTSPDLCILFRTFDLQINPSLTNPGLPS